MRYERPPGELLHIDTKKLGASRRRPSITAPRDSKRAPLNTPCVHRYASRLLQRVLAIAQTARAVPQRARLSLVTRTSSASYHNARVPAALHHACARSRCATCAPSLYPHQRNQRFIQPACASGLCSPLHLTQRTAALSLAHHYNSPPTPLPPRRTRFPIRSSSPQTVPPPYLPPTPPPQTPPPHPTPPPPSQEVDQWSLTTLREKFAEILRRSSGSDQSQRRHERRAQRWTANQQARCVHHRPRTGRT